LTTRPPSDPHGLLVTRTGQHDGPRRDYAATPSTAARRALRRRGFTLIDLLASIGVIVTLISILLPTLSQAFESARRVESASNLRQIGLGLRMWVDDHEGQLPSSVFTRLDPEMKDPKSMMVLHFGGGNPRAWDGLGKIFGEEYLTAWPVFYCPNHHGEHRQERYEDRWTHLGERIIGNYQYRLFDGLDLFLASHADDRTIVSDGLRTVSDYNHRIGNNMLKADLSVRWWSDGESVVSMLPHSDEDVHYGFDESTGVWAHMDLEYDPASIEFEMADPKSRGGGGDEPDERPADRTSLSLSSPTFSARQN